MKKHFLTFTVVCISLITGFGQTAKTKSKIEQIEFKKEISEQKFFETFVKEIEVIPLETTKESLIDKHPRFEVFNNQFYIYNTQGIFKILRFYSNGKFLNKIGTSGSGPEEYSIIKNIEVDKKGVTVLSRNLFLYNHNGKFISKQNLDFDPIQVCNYKDGYLISKRINRKNGRLLFTDSTGKNPKILLKERSNFLNLENLKPVTSSGSDLLSYNDCVSDTIHRISGLSVTPAVVFNMKEYKTSKEILQLDTKDVNTHSVISKSISSIIFSFYENHKYILSAHVVLNKGETLLLCMIKDKTANKLEWIKYVNNEANNAIFLMAQLSGKDEVYTIAPPDALTKLPEYIMKLIKNKSTVKGLKEEDNHVILKMKLK